MLWIENVCKGNCFEFKVNFHFHDFLPTIPNVKTIISTLAASASNHVLKFCTHQRSIVNNNFSPLSCAYILDHCCEVPMRRHSLSQALHSGKRTSWLSNRAPCGQPVTVRYIPTFQPNFLIGRSHKYLLTIHHCHHLILINPY